MRNFLFRGSILFLCMNFSFAEETSADLSSYKRSEGTLYYFKQMFGIVHKTPSRYSNALTTISCGHPLRTLILKDAKGKEFLPHEDWTLVKVGAYEGFVMRDYLTTTKGECFQDRFPKFFDSFDFEVSDLYYWGRLNDQALYGKSKVR